MCCGALGLGSLGFFLTGLGLGHGHGHGHGLGLGLGFAVACIPQGRHGKERYTSVPCILLDWTFVCHSSLYK